MFNTKRLLLILVFLGLVVMGCKDNSKNENEIANSSSSKINNDTGAHATIHFDDGRTIEMKDKRPSGNSNASSRFTVNISDSEGLIIRVLLDANDTPLKDQTYDAATIAQVVLTSTTNDGPIGDEAFRSYNEDAAGKEGEAKITITSFANDHAKGNFKATLYSPSHKKAVVEGAFSTTWKKKW